MKTLTVKELKKELDCFEDTAKVLVTIDKYNLAPVIEVVMNDEGECVIIK